MMASAKRILILLLVMLFCIGCQPTPEVDAVKQKDTNVLIDAVRREQENHDEAQTISDLPERFLSDFYTSTQNVHVVADVPIDVLSETGSFPMLRVGHRYLTDDERLTICRRLFGCEHLYVYEYRLTREMLLKEIERYMQEPTPEQQKEWMRDTESTEEELSEMLERRRQIAADLQRQYNELSPDEPPVPLTEWFGAVPDYSEDYENHRNSISLVKSDADTNDLSFLDHVNVCADECDRPIEYQIAMSDIDDSTTSIWFFNNSHKFGTERIDRKDYDKPHEGASVKPNDAIATVKACFEGICDFTATDVFWANNADTDGDLIGLNDRTRWAYCIHFTENHSGAHMPYCAASAYEQTDDYIWAWDYASLTAAVDGDGRLLSLIWLAPLKATDVIAQSTTLLPYDEIRSRFETHMTRMLADADKRDATLTVDSASLGLFRIREPNDPDAGLLVPVWFFTGMLEYSDEQKELHRDHVNSEGIYYDAMNPLLIINAVDGSIIDPWKGY